MYEKLISEWRNKKDEPPKKTSFDFKKGSKIRAMKDLPLFGIKLGEEFLILSDISTTHSLYLRDGWVHRAQICVKGIIEMVDLYHFRLLCPQGIENDSKNC